MIVAWQLLWPALALVVVTVIALVLRGVSLTVLRQWTAARSSWTSIADAIRAPSLLWCVVAGLYVANEVARDASLLPTRWHERLGLLLEMWLPQTFLVPVARSGVPPDEPCEEMRWAQPHAEVVLRRNPDLELHHMQDPVQDWLMAQRMSYFRLKRRTLGVAYERFLRECLAPGGTIIVVECGLRWPTTRRGDRHVWIAARASRVADHSRETNQARAGPPPQERPPRVELESRAC